MIPSGQHYPGSLGGQVVHTKSQRYVMKTVLLLAPPFLPSHKKFQKDSPNQSLLLPQSNPFILQEREIWRAN
jgi:hypothetical protein